MGSARFQRGGGPAAMTEHPLWVKQLARSLPEDAGRRIAEREGRKENLGCRFLAIRVQPAHHDW